MTLEPEFQKLPETETFNVWRVENFEVVPWKDVGYFYSGDSYIVLSAVKVGGSERVKRDIYFWLGQASTQDEMGTAAIKTVELDDHFGGEPIQHREVQGHESAAFVDLFEKYGGVHYMDGGVDSGFKKVEIDSRISLFQIKGRRRPVMQQVPAAAASLNQGDCFILVTPTTIFLWVGKNANMMEKNKAGGFYTAFKSRLPKHKYERLDGGETSAEFWEALGGEGEIASAAAGGEDDAFEKDNKKELYAIKDGNEFELVCEGAAVTKDTLKSDGFYLIKKGGTIVIYNGSGISHDVAKHGVAVAVKFIKDKGLPNYISVATAREGVPSSELELILA